MVELFFCYKSYKSCFFFAYPYDFNMDSLFLIESFKTLLITQIAISDI